MRTFPRTRKRVHAIRRAPDGSAFQKCESCGVSVAIALLDMHECEPTKNDKVKRFRGVCEKPKQVIVEVKQSFDDQPRSPFHFFMEIFVKSCTDENAVEINRKGFEIWKAMSDEERKPYIDQAKMVDYAYQKKLLKEVNSIRKVEYEATSGLVAIKK